MATYPATFPASVEMWRPYLNATADAIPIDFLLAWIRHESAGNPCSYTGLRESGIFQLMPPDNTRMGGTTEERLRTACAPGTQNRTRQLTDEEIAEQVVSGIKYVEWARGEARKKLNEVDAVWPENSADFWAMVKLKHTYPTLMNGLKTATLALGRPPASWNEFVEFGAKNLYGASKWIPFTTKITRDGFPENAWMDAPGFSATGGPSKLATTIAAIGGLALGAWLTTRHMPWTREA